MNPFKIDPFKSIFYAPEIEKRFYRVYESVISNYFVSNKHLIWNAKEIINYEKRGKDFKSDLLSYQLFFLLSFGVQDTVLSARKFCELFVKHSKIIKNIPENNPIKILCVEGESVPTVVGVCQVIDEIRQKSESTGKFEYSEIRISVIETRENWRRLCGNIIDTVNSFFKNVELKLDFIEDFTSLSSQELTDRIGEMDIVIVARVFQENRNFTESYSFMRIVLNEMKENAVLFYNDSFNEIYYENLKHLISKSASFSEINSCQVQYTSFEDLKNEELYADFPITWETDFQPVIFSTWIKDAISKKSRKKMARVASTKLNPKISSKKSGSAKLFALKKHVPKSKNQIKPGEHLNNESGLFTSPLIDTYEITKPLDNANHSISLIEQMNIINGRRKVKSSVKNCKIDTSTVMTTQTNESKEKNKSHSDISNVKKSMKITNQSVSLSTSTNVVNAKKKAKSSPKTCNLDASSVMLGVRMFNTDSSKLKHGLHEPNISALQSSELALLHKQINDIKITKSFQKPQCLHVSSNDISSEKAFSKVENKVKSSKELGSENFFLPTTETILPKKKTKAANSKVSNDSIGKITPSQTLLSKQIGNVSHSVMKADVKQNNKSTTSEKPSKNKIDPESKPLKGSFDVNSSKKKRTTVPVTLTKKSIKNNAATEKVKLTGKFARMDLEKKNKDERHKVRAKKASFEKYANFDYDD